MKKYLLLMMLLVSVIYVVPAMAETDANESKVQLSDTVASSEETASETVSETVSETISETQTEVQTPSNETSADIPSESKVQRRKGPGEPLETSEEETQAPEEIAETPAPVANRWGIVLNDEEKDLLARITMLESGGESDLGQQAVVEVILNRVYSPVYPDSVYGVLSQVDCGYRQFSTWKNRNSRYANPSARVTANVNAVLNGETSVLPYETVYFSRKAQNKRVQARIGNHVFCNQ